MYNRQAIESTDFVARQIDYNPERRFGQKRKSYGLAVWRADVDSSIGNLVAPKLLTGKTSAGRIQPAWLSEP